MKSLCIIDDEKDMEPIFRHLFKKEIEEKILEICFFTEPRKALFEIPKKNNICLIMTDLQMPEMSGFEFIEKLKILEPSVPIVVVSAYDDKERTERAIKLGASSVVSKPVDFTELRKEISYYGCLH